MIEYGPSKDIFYHVVILGFYTLEKFLPPPNQLNKIKLTREFQVIQVDWETQARDSKF